MKCIAAVGAIACIYSLYGCAPPPPKNTWTVESVTTRCAAIQASEDRTGCQIITIDDGTKLLMVLEARQGAFEVNEHLYDEMLVGLCKSQNAQMLYGWRLSQEDARMKVARCLMPGPELLKRDYQTVAVYDPLKALADLAGAVNGAANPK